jgi:hypothetical protein
MPEPAGPPFAGSGMTNHVSQDKALDQPLGRRHYVLSRLWFDVSPFVENARRPQGRPSEVSSFCFSLMKNDHDRRGM